MFTAATRFGTRYAAPAAASGVFLALSYSSSSPTVGGATVVKAEAATGINNTKAVDITAIKKSIAELIDDDAERRGDGTSLTGTFVRVSNHRYVASSSKHSTFSPSSFILTNSLRSWLGTVQVRSTTSRPLSHFPLEFDTTTAVKSGNACIMYEYLNTNINGGYGLFPRVSFSQERTPRLMDLVGPTVRG